MDILSFLGLTSKFEKSLEDVNTIFSKIIEEEAPYSMLIGQSFVFWLLFVGFSSLSLSWALLCAHEIIAGTLNKTAKFHFYSSVKLIQIGKFHIGFMDWPIHMRPK